MKYGFLFLLFIFFPFYLAVGSVESHWTQEALNRSLRQEAISGAIPRIEYLLQNGADINGKAPHGETALDYAIRFGRFGAAIKLIQLGADPNSEDDSGLSVLLRASSEPNASRVIDALLLAGADVNHHDLYGRTALIHAARSGCVRNVTVILVRARNHVAIDASDDENQTASDVARNNFISEIIDTAKIYQQENRDTSLSRSEQKG